MLPSATGRVMVQPVFAMSGIMVSPVERPSVCYVLVLRLAAIWQFLDVVRAAPLFGFEFEGALFEFKHERPRAVPLFALPNEMGTTRRPARRGGT